MGLLVILCDLGFGAHCESELRRNCAKTTCVYVIFSIKRRFRQLKFHTFDDPLSSRRSQSLPPWIGSYSTLKVEVNQPWY